MLLGLHKICCAPQVFLGQLRAPISLHGIQVVAQNFRLMESLLLMPENSTHVLSRSLV
jgi:hypothetical protein